MFENKRKRKEEKNHSGFLGTHSLQRELDKYSTTFESRQKLGAVREVATEYMWWGGRSAHHAEREFQALSLLLYGPGQYFSSSAPLIYWLNSSLLWVQFCVL